MHDLTCCLISGMGCRSSKHQNSVADEENAENDEVYGDTKNGRCTEAADKNSNKGFPQERKLSDSQFDSKKRTAVFAKKPNKPFSQSQTDFFEMLERKINAGRDYTSEDEFSTR
ncbi:uncharacterized protein C1orf21 homolog [Hydractinia symbiolongicarpus]|uniref:uncharacterized protein C1orf21 homolog n=1 Tax=Hydractinia symbiolongicarpus TaxID=13093 RepID=UPI00254C865E|nr:uncharacterized protein C1orf21 homolog [Hydractinia symbiolongicarpus]